MLIQDTLIYMEDETKKKPAGRQGNPADPFDELMYAKVTSTDPFHDMWEKVFKGLAPFDDAELKKSTKNNSFLNNENKSNPNWPLRDGDL